MIFRQLFDHASSTYTYLIADPATGAAALIDPVREQIERDLDSRRTSTPTTSPRPTSCAGAPAHAPSSVDWARRAPIGTCRTAMSSISATSR
jgi:hypothetical protein